MTGYVPNPAIYIQPLAVSYIAIFCNLPFNYSSNMQLCDEI